MAVYRIIGKAIRTFENKEGRRETKINITARIVRAVDETRAKIIATLSGVSVIESVSYLCRNYEADIGSASIYSNAANTEEGII